MPPKSSHRSECGHAAPAPFLIIRCEALALLDARGEFMIAVCKLDAVPIDLEALRGAGIVRVAARQSSLRGRISMNEGQPRRPRPGPDAQAHEEVEQVISACWNTSAAREAGNLGACASSASLAANGSSASARRKTSR